MSEIVIENHTTVQTVETVAGEAIDIENIAGTATVVETTPTSYNVEVLDGTQNTLEVATGNVYEVVTETGASYTIETTTGPTGHAPVLYNGTAPPDEGTGTVGDLYLVDSGPTIGDLYQKSKVGWETPKGNLRGGIASVNGISGTHIIIGANNITTGVLPLAQIPTGITGSTVALGNHNHDAIYIGIDTTQTITGFKTFSADIIANSGAGTLKLKAGSDDETFMELFARTATPLVRSGYFGFAGAAGNTLSLINEINNGPITIQTQGTGAINLMANAYVNGSLHTAGGLRVGNSATPGYVLTADSNGTATWQQTANIIVPGTTAQYYRGDLTWQTLNKAAVGLANADNTSDAAKPISTATQTALDLKAPLASPTFTGTVTVSNIAGVTKAMVGLSNVANVDTSNAANITSGVLPIAQVPTGTSGTTVAFGNHNHDSVYVALTGTQTIAGVKTFSNNIEANAGPGGFKMLPGGNDHTFMAFHARTASPGTRSAYFGYPGAGSAELTLQNEIANGNLVFGASGTGQVRFNVAANALNGLHVSSGNLRVGNSATAGYVLTADGSGNGTWQAAPLELTTGTTAQYLRGDKTWQTLNAAAVGLGNVTNNVQVDLTSGQTITGAKVFNNGSNSFTGSGAGLTGLNAGSLNTGTVPSARLIPNTQRFLFTTGSEARPTGTTYVEWVGPVQPTNASNDDTWTDTSINLVEDPIISTPIGTIQEYGGSGSPASPWLACNGAAISRTTYSVLYGIIGTTYGTGDGSTTFNLPNHEFTHAAVAKVVVGEISRNYTGPFATAVPGATSGDPITTLAGTLEGMTWAQGYATAGEAVRVELYIDGVLINTMRAEPSVPSSQRLSLSPVAFSVAVTAGTHYIAFRLASGQSSASDYGGVKAHVLQPTRLFNKIIKVL